jgi:hypothetical protein
MYVDKSDLAHTLSRIVHVSCLVMRQTPEAASVPAEKAAPCIEPCSDVWTRPQAF